MESTLSSPPTHRRVSAAVSFQTRSGQNVVMGAIDARLRNGNPGRRNEQLAASYARVRKSLLAYLRKHTGDAQVAEDLLHDVMLKALVALEHAENAPRNLTGWLYAVARNAAMDHHRRTRPTAEQAEDFPAPVEDDEAAMFVELSSCLRPLAEGLPETYRQTLIGAEFDGLSLAEVAKVQRISLSAAKTRTSRGRRLLRQRLVDCCRVSLSTQGAVVDFDAGKAAKCAPAASASEVSEVSESCATTRSVANRCK
jgi:RNA polymerase sigma-70 factor (ECF subfamily)